jgi:hypothetical protein
VTIGVMGRDVVRADSTGRIVEDMRGRRGETPRESVHR